MSVRSSWPRVLAGLVVILGSTLVSPAGEASALPEVGGAVFPLVATPTYKASQASGGGLHTCAVTTKGMPLCWGYNGAGQLGDNTTTSSDVPVGVYGLTKGIKAVEAGYSHSCALTTKGKVWCWGDNAYGQLGDNSTTSSPKPVAVYGLGSGVKAISAGDYTTCALKTSKKVVCWGYGVNGELGNNATASSAKPVGVYHLKRVTALSSGGYHTCALVSGGKPVCWGYNGVGELGNNTAASSPKPVAVYGLTSGVKQINGGTYHSCAVVSKGKVKCWGYNAYGQLGNNTTTNSLKPVTVSGLNKGYTSVKAGYGSSCAIKSSGKAKCWGYNNFGQLGDNTTTGSQVPVDVYNLTKASKLTVGYYHACVVNKKGALKCWGYNTYGGLGDDTTTNSPQPVLVAGF
jgi:alpha-tubulin suppressor-like RCC1 family protein